MSTRDIFSKLPTAGSEHELDEYLDANAPWMQAKRVHMQVVIVHIFHNFPDVTNEELTAAVTRRFPNSVWGTNPDARANADRRKYNNGEFKCMAGYHPKKDDPEYAIVPKAVTTPHDGDDDLDPELEEALNSVEED